MKLAPLALLTLVLASACASSNDGTADTATTDTTTVADTSASTDVSATSIEDTSTSVEDSSTSTSTEDSSTSTEDSSTSTSNEDSSTSTSTEDSSTPPEDTTVPPEDTAVPPEDTAVPPEDTTVPPEDTTVPPEDTTVAEDTTVEPDVATADTTPPGSSESDCQKTCNGTCVPAGPNIDCGFTCPAETCAAQSWTATAAPFACAYAGYTPGFEAVYATTDLAGYASGWNGYQDHGYANQLTVTAGDPPIVGAALVFFVASNAAPTSTVNVAVWSGDGTGPKTLLASKALALADIHVNGLTYVAFDAPVTATGTLFIGLDFTYPPAGWPSLALGMARPGSVANRAWDHVTFDGVESWEPYDGDKVWQAGSATAFTIDPVRCP